MRPSAFALVFAVLITLLPCPAPARPPGADAPPTPLVVGNRVRLWAPAIVQGKVEGTVTAIDGASLIIDAGGSLVRIRGSAITRLEVSEGRHRQARKGLLIGAGIGTAGLAAGNVGFFATGVIYGAGIGVLTRGDRWREVPLEPAMAGTAPKRGPPPPSPD